MITQWAIPWSRLTPAARILELPATPASAINTSSLFFGLEEAIYVSEKPLGIRGAAASLILHFLLTGFKDRTVFSTQSGLAGAMGYGIFGTIIVGFFVGLVARFLKPGNDKMGFILTTLLGIVGASVGAFLGQALGLYQVGQPVGFLGAVVGAMLLLVVLHLIFGRSKA